MGKLEFEKCLTMIMKQQKQVIKPKTKIHTEVHYFALKLNLNNTNKERKYSKEFIKKLHVPQNDKWGVLIRSGGLEKTKKIN